MGLPEQYDTKPGETGEHFSGGQIQCLTLCEGCVLQVIFGSDF